MKLLRLSSLAAIMAATAIPVLTSPTSQTTGLESRNARPEDDSDDDTIFDIAWDILGPKPPEEFMPWECVRDKEVEWLYNLVPQTFCYGRGFGVHYGFISEDAPLWEQAHWVSDHWLRGETYCALYTEEIPACIEPLFGGWDVGK